MGVTRGRATVVARAAREADRVVVCDAALLVAENVNSEGPLESRTRGSEFGEAAVGPVATRSKPGSSSADLVRFALS
jgi:hypothetical protein